MATDSSFNERRLKRKIGFLFRISPKTLIHWLRHWPLSQKMLAGYCLAFSITVFGTLFGFSVANQAERKAAEIEAESVEDLEDINQLKGSLLKFIFYNQNLLSASNSSDFSGDSSFIAEFNQFSQAHQNFRQDWYAFLNSDEFGNIEPSVENASPSDKELVIANAILREHENDIREHLSQTDLLIERIDANAIESLGLDAIQAELNRIDQNDFVLELDVFIDKLTSLQAAAEEEHKVAVLISIDASVTQTRLMVGSIILSGLLGLLVMHLTSRLLLKPLEEITQTTQKSIQEANFDLQVPVRSRDEVGTLAQTFNEYTRFVRQLLNRYETSNQKLKNTSKKTNIHLQDALEALNQAQMRMMQNEKLSSLGQLVAGVAHEINTPTSFIHGNLLHVKEYSHDLLRLLALYQRHYPAPVDEIRSEVNAMDLDFIKNDLPKTLTSMQVGSSRIREVVNSLRNFSRLDEAEFKAVDIHEGLDSTLVILQHRLKARPDRSEIQVIKNYAQELPPVKCYAGLLNQVFMNIIANAIDALETRVEHQISQNQKATPKQIILRTSLLNESWVQVGIIDNGIGMSSKVQKYIFDPFFTTKPVGEGKGMGLSMSYQIVTDRHGGALECLSTPGKGTQFMVQIPISPSSTTLSTSPLSGHHSSE